MNPYEPPRSEEPAAEPAVMEVRYGLGYTLSLTFNGLVMATSAIRGNDFVPSWVLFSMAAFFCVLAVICWRGVFFEVFEDRIEFLSPISPKQGQRRSKPLESVDSGSLF